MIPILAQIEDTIVQAHYVSLAAQKLGVPVEAVIEEVQKGKSLQKRLPKEDKVLAIGPKKKNKTQMLEEQILIFGSESAIENVLSSETRELIENQMITRIIGELKTFLGERKTFELRDFSASLPDELRDYFNTVVLQYSDEENVEKQYLDAKKELTKIRTNQKRARLLEKIRLYEEKNDETGLESAQRELDLLNEKEADRTKA